MKPFSMAPRAQGFSVSVSFFALAGCLTWSSEGATPWYGDYSILPGSGENGNLSVAADLTVGDDVDVTGDLGVQGMIDFGNALSFPGMAGVTMQYLGTGDRIGAFDLTDATGTFLWRDNAGGTVRPKMKLSTDNVLSVYNAAGASATITLSGGTGQINLTGTGSGISANGTAIFTVGSTGNVTWDRALAVTSTTVANSSTTGALTVAGGLGVAMDSYFNGVRVGRGKGNLNSNMAVGLSTLSLNTTGDLNTAVGPYAMEYNTSGRRNTAVGTYALNANSTGVHNTAVGFFALGLSTGSSNTAVGRGASFANSTGTSNTAVGDEALTNNSTGVANTGVGRLALQYNQNVNGNTGMGYSAMSGNHYGSYNSGFGYDVISNNRTGSYNVALGYQAGKFQQDGTSTLMDPENSVYIGTQTRGYSNADSNSIVIGFQAIGEGANTTVIGNTNTQSTRLHGQTKTKGLEVRGGNTDLNDQVVVEAPVGPTPPVRALRVLADGTVLVKPSGDIPMTGFTTGTTP